MDQYSGADALGLFMSYPSGGIAIGNSDDSLGGGITPYEINARRFIVASPIPPIAVAHIHANNAFGAAYVAAVTTTSIKYKAPGDTAYGSPVTMAYGDTKVLVSGDGVSSIRLTQDRDAALTGLMTLNVVPVYGNVVGMGTVTNAERVAQTPTYRAIFLKNMNATLPITAIKIWGASAVTQAQALEAPVAGVIQTVANQYTAPSGVSWNTGITYGAGLTIASLAVGATYGLWFKRVPPTTASPGATQIVYVQFTINGVTYTHSLSGMYAIENAALAGSTLLVTDASYNTVVSSFGTLPLSVVLPLPGSGSTATYRHITYASNAYGLSSIYDNKVLDNLTIEIGDDGTEEEDELSAPFDITLSNTRLGYVQLTAKYNPNEDADPATYWKLWVTSDGTEPNTSGAATATLAMTTPILGMGNWKLLTYSLGPYTYGATIKVLVRSYYPGDLPEKPAKTSTNTTSASVVIDTVDTAAIASVDAFKGAAYGTTQETPSTVIWIDEPNNVYWQMVGDATYLWSDTVCVWKLTPTELRTTFTLAGSYPSGAATITGGIESTAGGDVLCFVIDSERCMTVDVPNKLIHIKEMPGTTTFTNVALAVPLYVTSGGLYFIVLNQGTGVYESVMFLGSKTTKVLQSKVAFTGCTTQEEVLQ